MQGRKYSFGIGKESARGTAVAPAVWIPLTEPPFVINKVDGMADDAGYGVIANATDRTVTKEWAEGEIKGNVMDESIGYLLLAALGSVSSTTKSGETAVYEHTFTMQNDNTHPSFTLNIKNDVQQLKHALGMLQSLKLSCEAGQDAVFTASFLAKKGAAASDTVSYSSERRFFSKMAAFSYASTLAGLDSSPTTMEIRSFEISIDKNVEPRYVCGNSEPSDIRNRDFVVEGNIEAYFDDATMKQIYEGGTSKALRVKATHTDTIGNSSNPTIQIDLPKVQFDEWSPSGGLGDDILQTIRFRAFYSLSDAMIAKAILTNEKASY